MLDVFQNMLNFRVPSGTKYEKFITVMNSPVLFLNHLQQCGHLIHAKLLEITEFKIDQDLKKYGLKQAIVLGQYSAESFKRSIFGL